MQHLGLPATDAEDDAIVEALCADPLWEDHRNDWLAAYECYREVGGNPWSVQPAGFEGSVKERMYNLYTSKRKTVALTALRDMQLASCPMCGSSATGALDHHLPREEFGEFSIMRANLVPACTHCNSSSKGKTFKGNKPERVWMPPVWQEEFSDCCLRTRNSIGRVSGLFVWPERPRAGMQFEEQGPHRFIELGWLEPRDWLAPF